MGESCVVCDKEAVLQCSGCGKVLYCSEEHKKNNSSLHKTTCKPYRVEKNSKYGRYLVASRDVKQGELLLRERPVVVGPRVDSLPACLECLTLLYPPVSRCSVCGTVPLCSRCTHNTLECQFYSSLTQEHKDLCLKANNQHVLPLKVLLHIKSKDAGDKYRDILKMESHLEKRKGTSVWISHHKNVVELLQKIGAISESTEDFELVQQICGVLDVNSFEVRGAMGLSGMGMRLRGIYLEAALMAHDCITNVHLSVDDNFVMSIRASVDIPEGQIILYNYTDPLQTTCERQKHLQEGKYFCCSCKRCEDPTELGTYMGGVKCPRCKVGYIVPSIVAQGWSCDRCSHKYSSGLMSITSVVARDYLDALDRTDPQQLEMTLKRLSSTFSPTHSIMIDLKQSIVAAYRELEPTKENVRRKVELCKELLPILRLIEPGISRLRGITLYELHVGLVTLAQEYGEADELKEAEEVLKEAVNLLLYEPKVSPEGELARQAMSELKSLKNLISKQELKDKKKNKARHKK